MLHFYKEFLINWENNFENMTCLQFSLFFFSNFALFSINFKAIIECILYKHVWRDVSIKLEENNPFFSSLEKDFQKDIYFAGIKIGKIVV